MTATQEPLSLQRIVTAQQAAAFARALQQDGVEVAFTNGCFDVLHAGHVAYLEVARAMAGALIVGVNSDASVRRLKGPGRPVVPQEDRARVVAALRAVDRVVIFEEETAASLIELIRPNLYVKGADYADKALPEEPTARAVGARIVLVPLLAGRSTSALIERLRHGGRRPESAESEPAT
ncbi:adenylyltransferase/cytidyltransferase family protein [Geochorda subterranea]|uniref:Adenylyltransferase/cytidyltransferase family protein n=1 Tax=Geochorda subterranea TaxID=3109564 RepID=A0ABZ1BPG3_9FIRM|nr:adenylyltransferase/cytidyltransferase family protein [Limnochorda sp. LNt]WRP14702.1 adenylyltransferase/cytidyltransferase family protein [Limnochorda sp. LNt]